MTTSETSGTVRVWRLECPETRNGPYNVPFVAGSMDRNHPHPLPECDIVGWMDLSSQEWKSFFFGFAAVADLEAWMGVSNGSWDEKFVVGEYDVPADAVLFGETQVAFRRSNSTLVRDYVPSKIQ